MRIRTQLAAVAILAGTAACTPNETTSVLPAGVSVEWERDAGGVVDAFGNYGAAWETRITSASGTVGPTANGVRTVPPTAVAVGVGYLMPDGSDKYRWNGYAGESISATGPGTVSVSFPVGSCTVPVDAFDQVRGIAPSPDGTKAAVLVYNSELDIHTTVSIVRLQPTSSSPCPQITAAPYAHVGSLAAATGSSVTNPVIAATPLGSP